MELLEILRRPYITEKSTAFQGQNKYVFEVTLKANKHQIKQAVEKAFNVRVRQVHIIRQRGKVKYMGRFRSRSPDTKKAIVTLRPGDKIELFQSV